MVIAEVPSVVHWLPQYVGMGLDRVSIGGNDLTQLMPGVDRDSDVCAELFDESDPAVLDAIAQIIEKAQSVGDYYLTVRIRRRQPTQRSLNILSGSASHRCRLIPMRLARRDTPSAQPNDADAGSSAAVLVGACLTTDDDVSTVRAHSHFTSGAVATGGLHGWSRRESGCQECRDGRRAVFL